MFAETLPPYPELYDDSLVSDLESLPTTVEDRIKKVFYPYADERAAEVKSNGCRFAYYTTAETAVRILKDQKIWMRNTATMNDYMEGAYGFNCLHGAYESAPGKAFKKALDECFPGLAQDLTDSFNAWLATIRRETFITCVSEHLPTEDQHGRLSMWRAYGGRTGVALVLNGGVMFSPTDALGAYSRPVAYLSSDMFADRFLKIAEGIQRNIDFAQSLGRDRLKGIAFDVLRAEMLCTKHPGFHEEREWRVIACPKMYPSKRLESAVEVINGTPQTVLKMRLENAPDEGLVGLSLPELLNKIIIGPCENSGVVYDAFVRLLTDAGVSEPENKIVLSDIPLRQALS